MTMTSLAAAPSTIHPGPDFPGLVSGIARQVERSVSGEGGSCDGRFEWRPRRSETSRVAAEQVTQTPDAPARLPNGGTVTDEFDNQGPGKKGDPTADPE